MSRFLEKVSKTLAVVGVLVLMWTATEVQQAKVQAAPVPGVCSTEQVPMNPNMWYCTGGSCTPVTTCCSRPFPVANGLACCGTFPCQFIVLGG